MEQEVVAPGIVLFKDIVPDYKELIKEIEEKLNECAVPEFTKSE